MQNNKKPTKVEEIKEHVKNSTLTSSLILSCYTTEDCYKACNELISIYTNKLRCLLRTIDDINFYKSQLDKSIKYNGNGTPFMRRKCKTVLLRMCALNNLLYTLTCFDAPLCELRKSLNETDHEDLMDVNMDNKFKL